MSKRQVIVLWAIALLLVATLIAVKSSQKSGYQSSTERSRGDTLLADFDPAEVAKLQIRSGEESADLEKKEGSWVVVNRDGYPADVPAINELLRTLDEVTVTQGIEADSELAPRFGMDPKASDEAERGTELVLANDAGTELAHLTFGKNIEGSGNPMSPFGGGGATGRFVLNRADSSGVYITNELFPTLNAEASNWLDDEFIKVEKIESIAVSEPGKPDASAWKLTREDDAKDFVLDGKKDSETIDNTALSPFKNLLSYARFDDVVPAAEAAAAWQADKKQTAVIKTFDGFTYDVTFGPPKADAAADGDAQTPNEDYLMTVSVEADLPAEREKVEGESEEDGKKNDEAFINRKKELEEKLATTKKLEGRTFKVTKYTVDSLLKDRSEFIKPANETFPKPGTSSRPPSNAGAGRPRVQAVTPPVAIPPRPTKEDPEE